MKSALLLIYLFVLSFDAWANLAPPELICRAKILHSANRTVKARLRSVGYIRSNFQFEFDTPLGPVTLTQGLSPVPSEPLSPANVFDAYFESTVDRDRNWIVCSPNYPWFHPLNHRANCHAFASASRVAIPTDFWLPADKTRRKTYGDGYEVLLRSYFEDVAEGSVADAQAILTGEGAREGDLVVFGRNYPSYFFKEHSGLLFWHEGEWKLLHKVGEGPVLLTPIDDVIMRYEASVPNFRVYRAADVLL